ncbi:MULTISPECIES: aminoglycoside phosphotransferase family protein [unclassified Thioalkalivibrio]|uniref:aminoglycoside phosphotransferase family protein n=1 Tax=unclassified Thioalkalivibrio TaxID=2621013 RepID=UPI000377B110|nr:MULTISPECIES: phosphotransferase [unclassified Thioalkalivibrio]
MIPDDRRSEQLQAWLKDQPGRFTDLALLRADASFRRYFRLCRDDQPVVLMDAPPEREATEPFVEIARLLESLGLRPPRILAHDPATGFVLLEDLGDRTFTRALAEGAAEGPLYDRAIDTLIQLHRAWPAQAAKAPDVPAYDTPRLLDEAALFADWYWPEQHGTPMSASLRNGFLAAWREALEGLPVLPGTLVLRDFHVDNLMLPPGEHGDCAVLDFQDAVIGSPAYDVVSLLEDARREVSPATVERALKRYAAGTAWDPEIFMQHYRVLGVQRTTKILGIFVRLARRDAKPRYLEHLPRLHRLLAQGLSQPALAPVAGWFQTHMPERMRED